MKNQLIALVVALALPAIAKEPLNQSNMEIYGALLSCELTFISQQACAQLQQAGGTLPPTCAAVDLGKCISDGKAKAKKAYEKTLKLVTKPAARAALKEYYIVGISAIQGVEPQSEERKMNYEKRQGDNKNKLDEMWTRFEVEN